MSFQKIVDESKKYFPKLKIKYKNQSNLMKFISIFVRNDFMTHQTTSVGNTIYFPNEHFLRIHPIESIVLFLYELAHFKISKKRAYLSSLYVIQKLSKQMHFVPHLELESQNLLKQLQGHWPGNLFSLENEFNTALIKIRADQRPFEDPIFDILDDLVNKI